MRCKNKQITIIYIYWGFVIDLMNLLGLLHEIHFMNQKLMGNLQQMDFQIKLQERDARMNQSMQWNSTNKSTANCGLNHLEFYALPSTAKWLE